MARKRVPIFRGELNPAAHSCIRIALMFYRFIFSLIVCMYSLDFQIRSIYSAWELAYKVCRSCTVSPGKFTNSSLQNRNYFFAFYSWEKASSKWARTRNAQLRGEEVAHFLEAKDVSFLLIEVDIHVIVSLAFTLGVPLHDLWFHTHINSTRLRWQSKKVTILEGHSNSRIPQLLFYRYFAFLLRFFGMLSSNFKNPQKYVTSKYSNNSLLLVRFGCFSVLVITVKSCGKRVA